MKNSTHITSVVVILAVFTGLLSSCSSKGNSQGKKKDNQISKQSKLTLYQNRDIPFQFRYPQQLQIAHKTVTDTAGWSYASTAKGELIVQLKLKSSVQPKTNLEEATFTIGRTDNPKLVKKCMQKPAGYMLQADSLQKGEQTYYHTKYSSAGAGNYYTVVQYRTIHHNYCYSIEEMVHITNIHNYPPDRGISAFDSTKVWDTLDTVWQSFHFLK